MRAYHPEVLSTSQRKVLRQVGPLLSERSFYLAGGTAVAIHLGHRRSLDLDWFIGEPIGDVMALAAEIQGWGIRLQVSQVDRGTLHGAVGRVRVTFLEYRYEMLNDVEQWAAYGCTLASPDDLAAMKLSAVAQRGAKKDFVDIYALGLRHRPLPELLSAYQRKYGIEDIAHVLYGLAYFDDADKDRMPKMLWDVDWRTVKRTIQDWVQALAR